MVMACHSDSLLTAHHNVWINLWSGDYSKCSYCHEPDSDNIRNCLLCHYHGNSTLPAVPDYEVEMPNVNYEGGEKLF